MSNSNFLDDKLYNHLNNRVFRDVNDFIAVLNELYKICEDHWKPIGQKIYDNRANESISEANKELKGLIDRSFNG